MFPSGLIIGEVDEVVGVGHVAFEDGTGAGDEHETGARAVVAPVVVGESLVAEHLVVESEAEEVNLAARPRVDGEFSVEVQKVEGEAALDIGVDEGGGTGEVGVFGREKVGYGDVAVLVLAFQRAFKEDIGPEGIEANLSAVAFLVAVAGGDVHDRRESAAVLGAEAAAVDVGVKDDIGLEDGVEADGVEGIVDNHPVEEAEVLYHGAAADVELATLVAGGVDAGQYLEVLRQVGGAADGGHLLDLRGSDFLDRDLCLYLAFFDAVVGDNYILEHGGGAFKGDVACEGLSLGEGDAFGMLFVAHVAHP